MEGKLTEILKEEIRQLPLKEMVELLGNLSNEHKTIESTIISTELSLQSLRNGIGNVIDKENYIIEVMQDILGNKRKKVNGEL